MSALQLLQEEFRSLRRFERLIFAMEIYGLRCGQSLVRFVALIDKSVRRTTWVTNLGTTIKILSRDKVG